MNAAQLSAAIAARVTGAAVYDFAEMRDCSTLVARATLEAEAFSELTGAPLDYHTDWRERIDGHVLVRLAHLRMVLDLITEDRIGTAQEVLRGLLAQETHGE